MSSSKIENHTKMLVRIIPSRKGFIPEKKSCESLLLLSKLSYLLPVRFVQISLDLFNRNLEFDFKWEKKNQKWLLRLTEGHDRDAMLSLHLELKNQVLNINIQYIVFCMKCSLMQRCIIAWMRILLVVIDCCCMCDLSF